MWIAALQRERVELVDGGHEDRDALCRGVIADAVSGRVEIATSTLSLVEVCKVDASARDDRDLLFDFFRHSWVLMVSVDTEVGQIARSLMMGRHRGLKPADATHIASAIVAEATELQTFDGRLLALDSVIQRPNGATLPIRRPRFVNGQMPLFDAIGTITTRTAENEAKPVRAAIE